MDRGFENKYSRYDLTHLKVSAEMARGAAVAVADFKDFLMERSIPNLVDKVMDDLMYGYEWSGGGSRNPGCGGGDNWEEQ